MLDKIWIFDTYSLMLIIGTIIAFVLFGLYAKKNKLNDQYTVDILILACISIIVGLVSAVLFQMLYDVIKSGETRGLAMTFYGGLVGGVITFILGYKILCKKYPNTSLFNDVFPIAPACITIAHAFGRIGCFLAGCCYGKETTSWLGVTFPNMDVAVYPTQLFEALFLFLLSIILFLLAYKKKSYYSFSFYLASYGIFRFLLEFLRGDERGFFLFGMSPSQWFSILALVVSVILFIWIKKKKSK